MANSDAEFSNPHMSIYRATRKIKRKNNSLYNSLRSIYDDAVFVSEISNLWPDLPLLANLRCGLWYNSNFEASCYFKSTDGHTNNLSFNTSRLNLHVAELAVQRGGCMIVDSTRKGKRFPDSMSKTIPIWTCVLNRAVLNLRNKMATAVVEKDFNGSNRNFIEVARASSDWDCSLHLPLWVPETEKATIEAQLEGWTKQLESSGADISLLAKSLKKPLRPLWISQKTVIWLNEVPEHDSWDFTPIMLVSASLPTGVPQQKRSSEFSWSYIPGAGDDEESWARGLTPSLFWKNVYDIINSGPDVCNQKVADIVEKDRVYRSQRGHAAPQVPVKLPKLLVPVKETSLDFKISINENDGKLSSNGGDGEVSWLGSTNLAVCSIEIASKMSTIGSILNCSVESAFPHLSISETYLHLPILHAKVDKFSLLKNLSTALNFAKINLRKGDRLVVCCNNGEDVSVCVCLAILTSLFDVGGSFDDGNFFMKTRITKLDMRQRLINICKYAVNARPSRGNLRQVYNFLNGQHLDSA